MAIFTTNGQIHHAWDSQKLQQMVDNRRRVGQRLFVQIDCDNIELKTRYKVFDSFRAQIRRGPEGRGLEEAVADALAHDADLDDFESTFVRQSLASSAQNITANFRKRLNRALRTKVPGLAPIPGKGKGPKPPKPKDDADLHDEPTSMTGPEEVALLIGGRATAYMEINAIDGFVPDRGEIALEGRIAMEPSLSVGDLRKGRLRLTLTASAEIPEGAIEVEVVLSWMRKNGGLGRTTWPMQINVVSKIEPKAKPEPKGGATGPTKDGGDVAFIWVAGRDQAWDDTVDRPDRRARRQHGKSDPLDAEAAARAVQSGRATGLPKGGTGAVEAIRALRIARNSAMDARSRVTNQLHALRVTAPDALRDELRALSLSGLLRRASTKEIMRCLKRYVAREVYGLLLQSPGLTL